MRLHVHEWGEAGAEPLVCLHGVTGHGERFRKLAEERLTKRFWVLAFDLRGHGRSGYEPPWSIATHVGDLLETADAHGVGRASWIGHSFGGRLVIELAARAPERVERVVLLDPAIELEPATALEWAEQMRIEPSFASPEEAIQARLDSGLLFRTPREILEEEMRQHLVAGADGRFRYRVCQSAVVTAWSEMCTEPPPLPQAPTLVVLGKESWLEVRVEPAELVQVVTVPGGHSVFWDAFAETADAVDAFLP